MASSSKKQLRLKILLGVLLFVIIGGIVFCLVCKNLLFVLRYSGELDTVIEKIGENEQIRFSMGNSRELHIYDRQNKEINEQNVDEELLAAVRELFGSKRVTYIGRGVPVSGDNWDQVYIGLEADNDRSEYLVCCKNRNDLPDYSRNRPAKCYDVVGDWYRVVFNGEDPTKGG